MSIKPISLPRTLLKRQLTTQDNVQLHTFTNASLIGMSAVICGSVENQPENQLGTHYVIGKSKIAPIKQLSIPKLELEAATIGFRLNEFAKVQLQLNADPDIHTWTDSQTVIDWINSKKKQKSFVSDRLSEINATQGNNNWYHIPTHLNPADHGTRGLKPTDIESKRLAAPAFLVSQSSQWPLKSSVIDTKSISIFASVCASQPPFSGPPVFDIGRFSAWNKLLITITAIFSFFKKLSSSWAKDQDSESKNRKERQHSTSNDIEQARNYIIKSEQRKSYSETIKHLQQKRRLDAKNS